MAATPGGDSLRKCESSPALHLTGCASAKLFDMHSAVEYGDRRLGSVAVLLPACEPGPELLILLQGLQIYGFAALVVVDDGSGQAFEEIFAAVAASPKTVVLRHCLNLGKGRALKSAFHYIFAKLPWLEGVVTADADGQHVAADIAAVATAMLQAADSAPSSASAPRAALGTRSLRSGVPLRSKLGNLLTRCIFRFVTRVPIADTQTGLRAIPLQLLPELTLLDGERYEYEMNMLAHLCRGGRRPLQVTIRTIYIDGNRTSHFNPVRDSLRIYVLLLRLCFSSLLAAAIDFAGFTVPSAPCVTNRSASRSGS